MEKFLSHRLNPICFNIPPPVLRIFFFLEEKYDEEDASFQRDIELERILWKIFEEGKKRERELLFNLCEIFLGKFFSSLLRRGNFRDEKERTQVEGSLVTKSFRGINRSNGATFDETTKGRKVAQILRGCVETFPNESGNFFFFFFPQHSKFSTRTKSGRVNLSMMRRINNKIVKFCDRSRYHVHT